MTRKQFTLYIANKPGAIARVTQLMAREGINIDGMSVSESTDVALVQIVPGDARKASKVLRKAKVAFTSQRVALVTLRNEPGALFRAVSRLSELGVDINYIYATGCTCDGAQCKCYAVISAPDLGVVEKACKDGCLD